MPDNCLAALAFQKMEMFGQREMSHLLIPKGLLVDRQDDGRGWGNAQQGGLQGSGERTEMLSFTP